MSAALDKPRAVLEQAPGRLVKAAPALAATLARRETRARQRRGRRLHLARRAARARPREPARARRARRAIQGGRVAVRAPRAMAVLVAIRHNPVIARL